MKRGEGFGKLTSIENRVERNVKLVLTANALDSEISSPSGSVDPKTVDHYEISELQEGERRLATLTFVLTDSRRVRFYATESQFDMGLLLDQLDGMISERRRVLARSERFTGMSPTKWILVLFTACLVWIAVSVYLGALAAQNQDAAGKFIYSAITTMFLLVMGAFWFGLPALHQAKQHKSQIHICIRALPWLILLSPVWVAGGVILFEDMFFR